MPIYVLKSNTIVQMQASLTSIFSLEVDPREAALRETEQAIGLVLKQQEPVELVAAERLHPAAAAPDGRAGEPRVALARPRAVPARPALPGRRPTRLALARAGPRPAMGSLALGRVDRRGTYRRRRRRAPPRSASPDLTADADGGLDDAEAARRATPASATSPPPPTTRTYAQILRENIFTFINNILFALGHRARPGRAGRSTPWSRWASSRPTSIVGIVQEIRAKRTLDRIALLTRPDGRRRPRRRRRPSVAAGGARARRPRRARGGRPDRARRPARRWATSGSTSRSSPASPTSSASAPGDEVFSGQLRDDRRRALRGGEGRRATASPTRSRPARARSGA